MQIRLFVQPFRIICIRHFRSIDAKGRQFHTMRGLFAVKQRLFFCFTIGRTRFFAPEESRIQFIGGTSKRERTA